MRYWLRNKENEESPIYVPARTEGNDNKKINKNIEEKYIWVEGYKGTKADMTCTVEEMVPCYLGGMVRDYSVLKRTEQYSLHERKVLNGEPIECKNGFHFCLKLKDVFDYYKYNFENRYFKVKALVKESDYEKSRMVDGDSKIAAKEIILYEEIFPPYEDVKHQLTYKSPIKDISPYNITKEDFDEINEVGFYSYFTNKFIKDMENAGFSNTFSLLVVQDNLKDIAHLKHIVDMATALMHEGVSKDMTCYLILNEVNRK